MSDKKLQIQEIYRGDLLTKNITKVDRNLLDDSRVDRNDDAEKIKPKSLVGKISMSEMGSAVSSAVSRDAMGEYALSVKTEMASTKTKSKPTSQTISYDGVYLEYSPSNKDNRDVYDKVMHWVLVNVFENDASHNLLLTTVDLILKEMLGEKNVDDEEDEREELLAVKKQSIEREIGVSLSPLKFHELKTVVNGITDYGWKNTEGADIAAIVDSSDNEELEVNIEDNDSEGQKINNSDNELEFDFEEESEEDEGEPDVDHEDVNPNTVRKHEPWSIYTFNESILLNFIESNCKAKKSQKTLEEIVQLVANTTDETELKEKLSVFFDFDDFDILANIVTDRLVVKWGLKYNTSPNKEQLLHEMKNLGLHELLKKPAKRSLDEGSESEDEESHKKLKVPQDKSVPQFVDLESLKFDNSSPIISSKNVKLPPNSYKKIKNFYEEIHIPPPEPVSTDYPLVNISELPAWAQPVFPQTETKTLNRVQSEVFPAAFHNDYNILLCAPTGAGKTNVAMLTVLRALSPYVNAKDGKLELSKVKIVYIAPLKALVQEQVREFQRRLQCYGMSVVELTGDSNLSRSDIKKAHVLVSTPEKWDVITRKKSNARFTALVKLIIIDEVHLLHDERGPVIENIVARTVASSTRLVALSATLPNYHDVAHFLNVEEGKGLFFFGSNFRPCPLAQQFIGVSSTSPLKKLQSMNQACYDKIVEAVIDGTHQVIVFVHSRKDTVKTAKWLIERLKEEDKVPQFLSHKHKGSAVILEEESANIKDTDMKEFVKYGFGVHHAGLDKSDRGLSEDMFADGLLKVLVSTATLAWGVNLPAHTVIIKGTDVYSPQLNRWVQLSPQDMLQMLGRAGRPRYDVNGEGIIITNKDDVQYYLAVLNEQLPIESQLVGKLVDSVNAEVVLGAIKSRKDAVEWIQKTYLYSRMVADPVLYKVDNARHPEDDTFRYFCEDLCHSALSLLHDSDLVHYDVASGVVSSTGLGRIASFYYLNYQSVAKYNDSLEKTDSLIELFKVFSSSSEFQYMSVREEEKYELKKLLDSTPVPIKETIEDASAKINVLLQSFISRLKLEGYALNADMVYINQNAGRLFRALFEISMKKKWAKVSKILLNITNYVSKRMWLNNCPLRQFGTCPHEVITRMEASPLPFSTYLKLGSSSEVAQAIRLEQYGKTVFDLLRRYPKVSVNCTVQPITQSVLKFDVEITPDWVWDSRYHSSVELFWILLEDINGDEILYTEMFNVVEDFIGVESFISFTIHLPEQLQERLPPNYFVTVISDKWLNCEYKTPVVLQDVMLPKRFPAPTAVEHEKEYTVQHLDNSVFEDLFDFDSFNTIQNQVFAPIYNSNENVLLCAPKGSGKTTLSVLALLNHWRQNKGRAVYVCPHQSKIDHLTKSWAGSLSGIAGGKTISKFTNDAKLNVDLFAQSHLILATPSQFESFSKRWRYRKNIQQLEMIIFDDAHEVSNSLHGVVYESVIARMVLMITQLECDLRVVSFANSLANARDFGEWMNVSKENIYNFSITDRQQNIEIHLKTSDRETFAVECEAVYRNMQQVVSADQQPLVFVPTRKDGVETSKRIIQYFAAQNFKLRVNEIPSEELSSITDSALRWSMNQGIAILYKDMDDNDLKLILKYSSVMSVIVCTYDMVLENLSSSFIFIQGTSTFQGSEYKHIDYSLNSLYEMVGCCYHHTVETVAAPLTVIILTTDKMKPYYKKFLGEGEPLESFIPFSLAECIVGECSNGVIRNKSDIMEWVTYTYFYRRIHGNPSYYGVKDVTAMGVSAYLTELFENVLSELGEADLISIESADDQDEDPLIHSLAGGVISAHHGLSVSTVEMYLESLAKLTKMSKFLEALSLAGEFECVSVRVEEPDQLYKIYTQLPFKISNFDNFHLSSPGFKVFVLLQAHFARIPLNPSFEADLRQILEIALKLVNAMVDVLSSQGSLTVLLVMELSQMLVQACWQNDSPLKQIPYFFSSPGLIEKCEEKNVTTVFEIMELEDEDRNEIMDMLTSKQQLKAVANFVNKYPNIEVQCASGLLDLPGVVDDMYEATVTVISDEEPEDLEAVSEKFKDFKRVEWWIVLGISASKKLLALRKVLVDQEQTTFKLPYSLDEAGTHQLTVWCVCDSYLYADKEFSFEVVVN